MERPLRAYKLTFATSSPALLKSPNADKDRGAFLQNSGKADVWQRKFCSKDLIPIMLRHGLDLVSAHLLDSRGEVQGMAICPRDAGAVAALYPPSEPDLAFEDGEVRTWLDTPASSEGEFSLLAIRRDGESYAMYRVGRDQFLEAIPVRRAGVRFIVSGDPQGAYYIVRGDGLGICDSRGCSRIARIDNSVPKYREGEIAARTDERIAELESQAKIEIRRTETQAAASILTSRQDASLATDPARRARVAKWFAEAQTGLHGWGFVLNSLEASYRDIRIASTERVRSCRESLANPPAQVAASGDAEVDAAVSGLMSNGLGALRICSTGNALSAQILIGQATTASRRLDKRLRALGVVAP